MNISTPKRLYLLIFCFLNSSQDVISVSKCWTGTKEIVFNSKGNATKDCHEETCVDAICKCQQGWMGDYCDECGGRMLLDMDSGYITDGPKDYAKARECSWIIQPATKRNTIIRLRLLEFATECGWDYMYVYDGDSASAPLLATFNGLMTVNLKEDPSLENYSPEVFATSGTVFIHFFSDVEYAMKGFNISYSILSCPQNCFGNGICNVSGSGFLCVCNPGWMGQACEIRSCPGNCSDNKSQGRCGNSSNYMGDSMCQCENGYQGLDCAASIPAEEGFWRSPQANIEEFNVARSSHTGVIIEDSMWLYGGIQFGELSSNGSFDVYNFSSNIWQRVEPGSDAAPSWRYGHSMVFNNNNNTLVIFGGRNVLTGQTMDEIWEYNISGNSWKNIVYTTSFPVTNVTFSPLALWGHSGTLVKFDNATEIMIVMFGFHTELEYSGFVFEYNIEAKSWSKAVTGGAEIEAAFGHSTTWDPLNRLCYVHGGISYLSPRSHGINDLMYSYDPALRIFKILRPSGIPRFLHSGVLIEGTILIYGGCTHNDSEKSTGALCFSPSFMAYYPSCDKWEILSSLDAYNEAGRYGHVALPLKGNVDNTPIMVVHGGYDGTILDGLLLYQTSSCSKYSGSETLCTGSHHVGKACTWSGTECIAAEHSLLYKTQDVSCFSDSEISYCQSLKTCASCSNTGSECFWCGAKCSATKCELTVQSDCLDDVAHYCKRFRTCSQCEFNNECHWYKNVCTKRINNDTASCGSTCGLYSSCSSCAGKECMWCSSRRLCVSTNSYVAQFPYGECMKWVNKVNQCAATEECRSLRTCDSCLTDPFCGWCDDGSQTGLGICQGGSLSGSRTSSTSQNVISFTRLQEHNTTSPVCAEDSWFFTSCPLCQCNGHSKCVTGTPDCDECEGHTTGAQCERCTDGYFGEATNGGSCEQCQCFNRATMCDHGTGACFCATKGQIGDRCERCDNDAKYYRHPDKNGTCFYRLLINYSFTFTLTPVHDRYITAINFENTPLQEGVAELNFESSEACDIKLTVFSYTSVERGRQIRSVDENTKVVEYEGKELDVIEKFGVERFVFEFSGSKYGFGEPANNATIRVYVSNFTVPTKIQVSVVQRNNSLLTLLLILFSCFLVLLLLTAFGWKLKMLYDNCQQRRHRAEQLEQMAARPFATVYLCLDDLQSKPTSPTECAMGPVLLNALSQELCVGGHACSLSVALWIPYSSDGFDGPAIIKGDGMSTSYMCGALAVGSALVARYDCMSSSTHAPEQHTTSLSNTKKLKIIFKRGKVWRTSGRAQNSRAGTDDLSATQRNVNIIGSSNNASDPETGVVRRHGHQNKRGRASFTSLRSRSVSPSNDIATQRSDASQLPNHIQSSALSGHNFSRKEVCM